MTSSSSGRALPSSARTPSAGTSRSSRPRPEQWTYARLYAGREALELTAADLCSSSPSAAAWTPSTARREAARFCEAGSKLYHPAEDRRDHRLGRWRCRSPFAACGFQHALYHVGGGGLPLVPVTPIMVISGRVTNRLPLWGTAT